MTRILLYLSLLIASGYAIGDVAVYAEPGQFDEASLQLTSSDGLADGKQNAESDSHSWLIVDNFSHTVFVSSSLPDDVVFTTKLFHPGLAKPIRAPPIFC